MSSSMSSAELSSTFDSPIEVSDSAAPEWKQEANSRLAAHRARRGSRNTYQAALPGMEESSHPTETAAQPKTKAVADRVAARYAKAPTYSEILAAEARNAARAAEAAAKAAGDARDAAHAILIGLDADASEDSSPARQQNMLGGRETLSRETRSEDRQPPYHARLAPRENLRREAEPQRRSQALITEAVDDFEHQEALDEPVAPVQPLPAKLLEFPRELVAARRARPRLAEGPLREEYDRDLAESQLRIFEVQPETISTEPAVEAAVSSWSSIRLDSEPHPAIDGDREKRQGVSANLAARIGLDLPLQTASLADRFMAGIVDATLIAGGFLVFVLVFVACTPHPPVGKPALIGAGVALFAFALIYQLLFFSFGSDTPGMRYAKIALCTFDDENPCRRTTRRRLGALLLSGSPLGLGILWAFFDDDRLGWHDRISRTYQRSYR